MNYINDQPTERYVSV